MLGASVACLLLIGFSRSPMIHAVTRCHGRSIQRLHYLTNREIAGSGGDGAPSRG